MHIDFDPKKKENLSKKNQKLFSHLLSTNFLNSYHFSNLEVYTKGFLGSKWEKKLCVLSNIGLFIFNKDDDKTPRLFPTIDASIYSMNQSTYNKPYVFKMNTLTGEEIVLAAFSKDDYDNWIRAVKRLKDETDRRKRDIEKKHNIQDSTADASIASRVSKSNRSENAKTAEFQTIDLGLEK